MSRLRHASLGALATAAFLLLAGCGKSAPASVVTPAAPTPAPTAAGATLRPAAPTPTPTGTPSKVACPAIGPLPAGSWSGPLTMRVTTRSGGARLTTTRGTGTLRLVVAHGRVTGGHWSLHWVARGQVDTGQAAASIVLPTSLSGTTQGSAAKPALIATWTIRGTATITKPVQESVPFTEAGHLGESLRITSLSCDHVTGSFPVSFASKDAQTTSSGTARWFATRR